MADHGDDRTPPELLQVEARLREQRAEWTPRELDQIKLRAHARARRSHGSPLWKGRFTQRRALVLLVAGLFIGGTAAGGIAGSGGFSDGHNASESQYKCDDHGRGGDRDDQGKTCRPPCPDRRDRDEAPSRLA